MSDRNNVQRLQERIKYLERLNENQCKTIERLQRETIKQLQRETAGMQREIEVLKGGKR